jgi:hypothetical protein
LNTQKLQWAERVARPENEWMHVEFLLRLFMAYIHMSVYLVWSTT